MKGGPGLTYSCAGIHVVLGTDKLDDDDAGVESEDDEGEREGRHGPHGDDKLIAGVHCRACGLLVIEQAQAMGVRRLMNRYRGPRGDAVTQGDDVQEEDYEILKCCQERAIGTS